MGTAGPCDKDVALVLGSFGGTRVRRGAVSQTCCRVLSVGRINQIQAHSPRELEMCSTLVCRLSAVLQSSMRLEMSTNSPSSPRPFSFFVWYLQRPLTDCLDCLASCRGLIGLFKLLDFVGIDWLFASTIVKLVKLLLYLYYIVCSKRSDTV